MRLYEIDGNNTVFVMFAYSNPPTKEYGVYYKQLKSEAQKRNSDYIIFINPIVQKEINPLPLVDVLNYTKLVYPNYNYSNERFKNAIEIMSSLSKEYSNIVFFVSDDEKTEYESYRIYAERLGFNSYIVESFKKQPVDYNRLARESVLQNDVTEFYKCFDSSNKVHLSKLFITLRKIMSLNESITITHKKQNIQEVDYSYSILKELAENRIKIDKFGNQYISNGSLTIISVPTLNEDKIIKNNKKTIIYTKERDLNNISTCIRLCSLINESTTTSSNVASTTGILNLTDTSRLSTECNDKIKKSITTCNTFADSMKYYLSTFGTINSDIIRELKKHYD